MDKTLRDKIKSMVLKSKEILENEIIRILEGKFGIYMGGDEEDLANLKDLTQNEIQFRKEITSKIAYLSENNPRKSDVINKIVRESAFTILNRLAALRFMDENNTIYESVTNSTQSKGFLLFKKVSSQITSESNIYSLYLDLIYDDLAFEIPVLFDRFNTESFIKISLKIIEEIIDLFNDEIIQEIWKQEETIGWIYQFFFSNEKELIREKKAPKDLPRDAHELIAINQFYTPSYVVQFLVDNTLGRFWKEMHPESKINEFCKYLIMNPPIFLNQNETKDITDIKLIDPACGSSHFLLYSFDVFRYIYNEAILNNWTDLNEFHVKIIPSLIIKNNLYGIDIDKRAIQLANLSLFLKLKKVNRELIFPKSNVIPADIILINGNEKKKLKVELKNDEDINNFIDEIWNFLIHSDELGSILNIKNKIINFSKQMYKKYSRISIDDFIDSKNRVIPKDYWKKFHIELIKKIKEISKFEKTNKNDFLKSEFEKSLVFLDLLSQNYDIVVMNPPYGYPTKIGYEYLKIHYPSSNNNIFCAFIENWLNCLNTHGLLGTIVDNTFLVKSSYTKFRQNIILDNSNLFLGVDLGWDVLDNAQVATTSICLRKNSNGNTFFLNLSEISEKQDYLNELIVNNSINIDNSIAFLHKTNSFFKFPNSSISYNIFNSILEAFQNYPTIHPDIAYTCQGLATADSKRFQRYQWEVLNEDIGKERKWVYFANGGQFSPFYRPLIQIVKWENDGSEIKNFKFPKGHKNEGKRRSVIRNEKFYFDNEGITWGKRGKFLNVSFLPLETIFSHEGHSMFPIESDNIWFLIGLLNSKLFQFTINLYCGLHKLSGYVGLLPFKEPNEKVKNSIIKSSKQIFFIKNQWYKGEEISPDFNNHWLIMEKNTNIITSIENSIKKLRKYETETIKLQEAIDNSIFELYNINLEDIEIIESEMRDRPKTIVWDDMGNKNIQEKKKELIESFISYSIGVLLNKWQKIEYIKPDIIGVVLDDPGSKLDLIGLLQKSFEKLFNEVNTLTEVEKLLGKDIRSYLQLEFFSYHYKKYKRCPIFWQLVIPSKKYSIWIIYFLLNKEYLLKIKNEIIEPKLKFEEEKLNNFSEEMTNAESNKERSLIKRLSKEISEKQKLIEEIKEFRKNLIEIIDLDLPFDLDDGVAVNIAPFYKLIPWDEPKKIWDKINDGEYGWSSLFKHLKKRGKI